MWTNSIDYLLKPIKRHELEATLVKHRPLSSGNTPDAAPQVSIDALVRQLRQQVAPAEHRCRFLVAISRSGYPSRSPLQQQAEAGAQTRHRR